MAERYLMTHSLLSSWLYSMKSSPYEDATSERDSYAEFLQVLRMEPTPTTEAMQNGIDFEDLVTAIVNNDENGMQANPKWFDAAYEVAQIVRGGVLQYRARKIIEVSGMSFVLYGRLDCLKAGTIIDIKFTKNYDVGKFVGSTQHPTYMEIIPEAEEFLYVVSNGSQVWKEPYRRDETCDITVIIADFITYLTDNGLMDTYKANWRAL